MNSHPSPFLFSPSLSSFSFVSVERCFWAARSTVRHAHASQLDQQSTSPPDTSALATAVFEYRKRLFLSSLIPVYRADRDELKHCADRPLADVLKGAGLRSIRVAECCTKLSIVCQPARL
jgi:hypothetical protein